MSTEEQIEPTAYVEEVFGDRPRNVSNEWRKLDACKLATHFVTLGVALDRQVREAGVDASPQEVAEALTDGIFGFQFNAPTAHERLGIAATDEV